MSEDGSEGQPSSSNWTVSEKSSSLPNFRVCPPVHGSDVGKEDNQTSFVQIDADFIGKEAIILITPPAVGRTHRYAPYFKLTPHPNARTTKRTLHNITAPESRTPTRWPSRLMKRRNAVSLDTLEYLRNVGKTMFMVPEDPKALMTEFTKPSKKKVTFRSPNLLVQKGGKFINNEAFENLEQISVQKDVIDNRAVDNLEQITAECMQMLNIREACSSSTEASILATNFRDSCQISTESLCTRFSAMPLNETTSVTTAPISSTSTSFLVCNGNAFNMSCLNL